MIKVTGKISYVMLGLFFAVVLYLGYTQVKEQIYLITPIDNVLQASLVVPKFFIDEDPVIIYDKIISEDVHISFSRELKFAETNRTVCRKLGDELITKTTINSQPITFDGFLGPECDGKVVPGQYYIESTFKILKEGFPIRYLTIKSNLFTASVRTE